MEYDVSREEYRVQYSACPKLHYTIYWVRPMKLPPSTPFSAAHQAQIIQEPRMPAEHIEPNQYLEPTESKRTNTHQRHDDEETHQVTHDRVVQCANAGVEHDLFRSEERGALAPVRGHACLLNVHVGARWRGSRWSGLRGRQTPPREESSEEREEGGRIGPAAVAARNVSMRRTSGFVTLEVLFVEWRNVRRVHGNTLPSTGNSVLFPALQRLSVLQVARARRACRRRR